MNYGAELLTALRAAVCAGDAILKIYHSDFSVAYKTDDSPLTLADKRAHEIIVSHLAPSQIPVLSEEGRQIPYEQRKAWQRLWVVDPLDGTKEFIKRNGEFTVNIALVENQQPVLGVICIPDKKSLYFAAAGSGAHKLERQPMVDIAPEMDDQTAQNDLLTQIMERAVSLPVKALRSRIYTIVGSRSHSTPDLEAYVEKKRRERGAVEFIAAGSSLKFCAVAEGRANIYPRLAPTMEWDTAAGQAIAESAGANVLAYETRKPLTYNKEDLYNPWFVVSREA